MVPRPESSVETENVVPQVSDISSEEGGSQPKQIKLTEPVDAEGMHTNPMDDTILSKKIGKLTLMSTILCITAIILPSIVGGACMYHLYVGAYGFGNTFASLCILSTY